MNSQGTDIRALMGRAAIIFVLTRLLVFGAAYSWLLLDPAKLILDPAEPVWHGDTGGHGAAAEPWRRWDALWFIKTARDGYAFRADAQSNTSIFPLYPMLIAGASKSGLDPIWAGVLISNLCLFGAALLLAVVISNRAGPDAALRALTAMMLFPAAFVLSGVYSESLFLLAVAAAFFFSSKRRWAEAGLCGFAAALTRFSGAALLLPLAVEFFASRPAGEPRRRALWLLLIPAGMALFFIHLHLATGSVLNYFQAQAHWRKTLDWPWVGLGWELAPGVWPFGNVLNIACVAVFSVLAVAVWKKFGAVWGLYTALGIAIPACASRWMGMPRYMLPLFPAFAAIGYFIKNKWAFRLYLAASAALMLYCFRDFLNWKLSL